LENRLSQVGFFVVGNRQEKNRKGESIMKKFIISLFAVSLVFGISNVYALDFGENITLMDKAGNNDWGWYSKHKEDQEVEKNCVTGQVWDLEGFFLDGTSLAMIGGYDFQNGHDNVYSGDIFLDVNGDMVYGQDIIPLSGNGNKDMSNVFGYDYVLDLNFADFSYTVYAIDETATLKSPYYRQNDTAGGWRYKSGGTLVGEGTIGYQTGLTDADVNFLGGSHNAVTVDLGFLGAATEFSAHFTMGCGNDDLIGQGMTPDPPVATPEPGTLLLLGGGLFGLFGIIRKRIS
jgi:hypothetical protein